MQTNAVKASAAQAEKTIRARASIAGAVRAKATAGVTVSDARTYTGAYEAVPTSTAQRFSTRGKQMREDFTVTEIRLHEAPNEYGTTLTIGD